MKSVGKILNVWVNSVLWACVPCHMCPDLWEGCHQICLCQDYVVELGVQVDRGCVELTVCSRHGCGVLLQVSWRVRLRVPRASQRQTLMGRLPLDALLHGLPPPGPRCPGILSPLQYPVLPGWTHRTLEMVQILQTSHLQEEETRLQGPGRSPCHLPKVLVNAALVNNLY